MFNWLFESDDSKADALAEARKAYWLDSADAGKDRYDAIREASWADADEWEQNLQRDEGTDD